MKFVIAAIVAAVTLLGAAETRSCESVQAIVAAPAYSQAIVAQQVYQPQIVQQIVAQPVSYAVVAPVVQQQIVVRQRVVQRRHPVRRAAQIVLPPYRVCK